MDTYIHTYICIIHTWKKVGILGPKTMQSGQKRSKIAKTNNSKSKEKNPRNGRCNFLVAALSKFFPGMMYIYGKTNSDKETVRGTWYEEGKKESTGEMARMGDKNISLLQQQQPRKGRSNKNCRGQGKIRGGPQPDLT